MHHDPLISVLRTQVIYVVATVVVSCKDLHELVNNYSGLLISMCISPVNYVVCADDYDSS